MTLSGAVSFANLIDSAAEVVVNKNYASKIKRNERPTIPVEVPQEVREAVILGELSTVFNEIKFGDVSPPPKPKGEEKSQKGEQSEESLEDNNDQDIESINQELESIRKELEDRSTESKTINFTVIEE